MLIACLARFLFSKAFLIQVSTIFFVYEGVLMSFLGGRGWGGGGMGDALTFSLYISIDCLFSVV